MTLTKQQKEKIVKLKLVDGLTTRTIAERIGCGIKTIETILQTHRDGKELRDTNAVKGGKSTKHIEANKAIDSLEVGQTYIWSGIVPRLAYSTLNRKRLQLGRGFASELVNKDSVKIRRYQ